MNIFDRAAAQIARLVGHPVSFALACLVVLVWAGLGPIAGYSDTWQLVINTSTTIVTFLMVFLIQNTQNRDNHALHLKIDELLRALDAADTRLVDLEERASRSYSGFTITTRPLPMDPLVTKKHPINRIRRTGIAPGAAAGLANEAGTKFLAGKFKSQRPRRRLPCLEQSC